MSVVTVHSPRPLAARLSGILRLLRVLEEGSTGLDFIRALLRYVAQVAGTDRLSEAAFRTAVAAAVGSEAVWRGGDGAEPELAGGG